MKIIKKIATFLFKSLILVGCSTLQIPESTMIAPTTDFGVPTLAASHTPQILPTITPISTQTSLPTPTPDFDCTDTETFEPSIGLHRNGSGLVRMGNGQLYGVDWSKDGNLIAVGTETGIYLFDAVSLEQVKYIETPHNVEVVRFSPDSKLLAIDDYDKVAVWDVGSGELVARFGDDIDFYSVRWHFPFSAEVGNISFHPNGRWIALHSMNFLGGSSNPSVEIWDIQTQKLVREWQANDKSLSVPDALFSPDGKWVASNWEGGVTIWDTETGEVVKKFLSKGQVNSFSPSGQKLTIVAAGKVRIVNIPTGTSISIDAGNTYEPVTGIISADDKKLVTHYTPNKEPYRTPISVWDVITGKKINELGVTDFVVGFSLNPIKNELATIGYDRQTQKQYIRIWDIDSGTLLRHHTFSQIIAYDLALSPDGSRLIAIKDENLHLYNAKTGGYLCMLPGKIEPSYHLSFTRDSKKMAYINLSGDAIVWDLETGKIEQTFVASQSALDGNESAYSLSIGHKMDKTKYWDLITWNWDNKNGDSKTTIINTCDAGTSIPTDCPGAYSPDGKLLIQLTSEGLTIQETQSKKILHTFDNTYGITNFTFSPDGRYILGLSYLDWRVIVWDSKTYEEIATINSGMEGEGPILGNQEFSFTIDGTKLATYLPYYHRDAVRIWNTQTWEMEKAFAAKGGLVDIAISGDGKLIAGLSGYVIYFWQIDE